MLFSLAITSYVVVPRVEETMPSFHATMTPESCGMLSVGIVGVVALIFSVDVEMKVVAGRIGVKVGKGGFFCACGRAPLGPDPVPYSPRHFAMKAHISVTFAAGISSLGT